MFSCPKKWNIPRLPPTNIPSVSVLSSNNTFFFPVLSSLNPNQVIPPIKLHTKQKATIWVQEKKDKSLSFSHLQLIRKLRPFVHSPHYIEALTIYTAILKEENPEVLAFYSHPSEQYQERLASFSSENKALQSSSPLKNASSK